MKRTREEKAMVKEYEEAVKGPGKFEGEPRYVPFFWFETDLDAVYEDNEDEIDEEDDDGSDSIFDDDAVIAYFEGEVSANDARLFPELKGRVGKPIYFYEFDSGFVVECFPRIT